MPPAGGAGRAVHLGDGALRALFPVTVESESRGLPTPWAGRKWVRPRPPGCRAGVSPLPRTRHLPLVGTEPRCDLPASCLRLWC